MKMAVATTGILSRPVVFQLDRQMPTLPVDREDLSEHHEVWGERPAGGSGLLELVDAAQLSGFGGAHVGVAQKWRSALAAGGGGTVVANAAEGEPASAKDAALWLTRPHLVLDGLAQAAESTGATDAVVWVHGGATTVVDAITHAIAERGSEMPVRVRIVRGPDRYVSGQSSAVVNALRGGSAVPRFVKTGARSWSGGPPVLVQNTETLARVAQVSRLGAQGSRHALVTVTEHGRRTVCEVGSETVFSDLADPQSAPPAAVLLGGYGGVWHDWSAVSSVPVLSDVIDLGAGVVALLPAGGCGVTEVARVATWMASESARGCGPCRFGLPELAEQLTTLAGAGRSGRAVESALSAADLVDGRGACAHPDGVARMVRSGLQVFADDVAQHRRGRCLAAHDRPVFPLPTGGRRAR